VQAVWSGASPGPPQLGWNRWSGEATVDSFQREYGELGTVEQVGPGSAVVDEGGLAVAWQESVGSVISESYRPNGLCRHLRSFRGDLGDCQFRDTMIGVVSTPPQYP
jgi:hypothetical protein